MYMVTADYKYPGWGWLVDFFAILDAKLLAWAAEDSANNLRSLFSGAYDLSATATPKCLPKIKTHVVSPLNSIHSWLYHISMQ